MNSSFPTKPRPHHDSLDPPTTPTELMWRRRLTNSKPPNENDNMESGVSGASAGSATDTSVATAQDNQSMDDSDVRASSAWRAAEYAKAYVDERVHSVAWESRASVEALSHLVSQVHDDQVVLEEKICATLRNIETAALEHFHAASRDLLSHHYSALQAFDSQVLELGQQSRSHGEKISKSIQEMEDGIATTQRATNTRVDDFEATTKRDIGDLCGRIDDIAERSRATVAHVAQLESVLTAYLAEHLPVRVATLERHGDRDAKLLTKLDATVEQIPDRVSQLEDRADNMRVSERRLFERVETLTAASKNAIDSAVTRMSGRIDRSELRSSRASLAPLEETRSQLEQKLEDVRSSAKEMIDQAETRIKNSTVPSELFVETAALAASVNDRVNENQRLLEQQRSFTETSLAFLGRHIEAQASELASLQSAQEDQAQTINAVRVAFGRQSQQIADQAQAIAELQSMQNHQMQELLALHEAQGRQSESVHVNSATTSHASQAFESLRVWVELKLNQQEKHCRAIRETCADLEVSVDERIEAWIRREAAIHAMRERAEDAASDATDSDMESDSNMSLDAAALDRVYGTHSSQSADGHSHRSPSRTLPGLNAETRLQAEIRLRAARLQSDRLHEISMRQYTRLVALERQVREYDEGLAAMTSQQTSDMTASEEEAQFEPFRRIELERADEDARLRERLRQGAAANAPSAEAESEESDVPSQCTASTSEVPRQQTATHPVGERAQRLRVRLAASAAVVEQPRRASRASLGEVSRAAARTRRTEAPPVEGLPRHAQTREGATREHQGRSRWRGQRQRATTEQPAPTARHGVQVARGRRVHTQASNDDDASTQGPERELRSPLDIARAAAQASVQQRASSRAAALRR